MKMTWAAGVVVLVLAAAAATAGAQSSAPTLQWEWESDLTPQSPGRWGLAALRNSEHVYCAGRMWGSSSSNTAIAVWRVNGDGSQEWQLPLIPAGSTACTGVAVAASGGDNCGVRYVWVTGYVDGPTGKDIYTACIADYTDLLPGQGCPEPPPQQARVLWVDRYNNSENDADGDDVPIGIFYDNELRVLFVGGDSDGLDEHSQPIGTDIVVLAYEPVVTENEPNPPLWVMRHDGDGHGDDHFADFQSVFAPQETEAEVFVGFYVAGTVWQGATKNDFVALKVRIEIEVEDRIEARATYNYNGSGHDICTGMDAAQWDLDQDGWVGGVFLGGYTTGLTTNGNDYLTVAFDLHLNQTPLWGPRTYDGPGEGSDKIVKVVYWEDGLAINKTVTVTGESYGDGTGFDFATTRYNAENGSDFWPAPVVKRFDNPANGEDRATDMVVDKDGNVYVGGYSENYTVYQTPTLDFLGVSYFMLNGGSRFVESVTFNDYITYNGTANGADRSVAIRVSGDSARDIDPWGDVFLFGNVSASVSYTTIVRHAVVKWTQAIIP